MARINIKPLSVNEAWKGRRYKTDKYKAFERSVLFLLPLKKPKRKPLKLNIVFGYSSKLSDIDNGLKPFLDCLVKKYGFDDRHIHELNVKKVLVDKGKEFIDFTISSLSPPACHLSKELKSRTTKKGSLEI